MDEEKLKRLRARYEDKDAFDADDPQIVAAAAAIRSPTGKRSLPYSGIPTFLGLPQADSLDDLDIAVVGLPMDLGVSNRSGARLGPRAVRNVERIGPYHPTFRNVPQSLVRSSGCRRCPSPAPELPGRHPSGPSPILLSQTPP